MASAFVKFMSQHGAEIKCDMRTDSTLLNMMGGKYRIQDRLNLDFLRAYSQDCTTKQFCFSEVVSDVAPFFIDIDYFDTELSVEKADEAEFKQKVGSWCTAITRAVSLVTPSDDDELDDSSSGAMTVESVTLLRDTMSSKSVILATAPARTVIKHGISGTKVGMHLLWPNLLVSKPTAQRLQAVVTAALYKISPGENWENIIDLAVYRPMASLRMLHSFKFAKCGLCNAEQYKEQAKLRGQAAVACKLKKSCTYAELKQAHDSLVAGGHQVPLPLKTFLSHKINCTRCKGRARVIDTAAGCYNVGAVLNGDGTLNSGLTDRVECDDFIAVYLMSVRRAAGTPETLLIIPANAPIPLQVTVAPTEDDDFGPSAVTIRDISYTADRFVRASIIGQEADVIAIAESWLNHQRTEWDQLQISSIYRLMMKAKLAQNIMRNGDPDYLVVITVRGFGANYCSMARRCHSSNHVYFVLNSSGVAVQKCHSTALAECCKSGSPFKIKRDVFVQLYPFEKSVLATTFEDVRFDLSSAVDESLLSAASAELFSKTVTFPDAASNAKFIQIQRKTKLNKATGVASELEMFYKRRKIGKYSADKYQEQEVDHIEEADVYYDEF